MLSGALPSGGGAAASASSSAALDRLDSSKMMQSMRGLTASSAQVGDDG